MNRSLVLWGLLSLFVLSSCKDEIPLLHQSREKAEVKVSLTSVEPSTESRRYSYVGVVDPARKASVSALHSGTLTSVKVRKGDVVSKGQVIAVVQSQTVRSAYDVAKANLEQARDGYDRATRVYSQGGISEVQYMDIKTKLAQAEASMAAASKSLDECTVRAPFDGVINDVFANEGEEMVITGRIASILDLKDLEIRISVHENDIDRIRKGVYALVDVPAFGQTDLKAEVIGRSLVPSPLSHSYECNLKLDRIPRGLLPGMSVKVRFETPGEESLVIPAAAVQLDEKGRFVWLFDEGIVRKVYVGIGGYAGKGVVVTQGLEPGDRIITGGYQKVSSGMKVVEQ